MAMPGVKDGGGLRLNNALISPSPSPSPSASASSSSSSRRLLKLIGAPFVETTVP